MKKYKYKLVVIVSLLIGGLGLNSCEDYLDINDDPNNPLEVQISQLLPSIQVDMVGALGMSSGGLSQITSSYMHQIVQRGTNINDYGVIGDDFGVTTPWNILYARALQDAEIMISQATGEEATHYTAIGQIMKAYSFSILVDVYGDVPYFDAFNGPDNLNPSYDNGALVYAEVFSLLDAAIANIALPTSKAPGGDDLIYAGNMDNWRKLAKTIKFKLYNQVRNVQNVTTEVNALITEDDMIGPSGDDFELVHGATTSPDDRNPAWVQEYGTANPGYYVSPFFFETMFNINTFGHRDYGDEMSPSFDPRVPYYFYNQLAAGAVDGDAENPCSYCPSISGTPFLAIYQFSFNIDPNEGFDQAVSQTVVGLYPIGGAYDDGVGTAGGGVGPTIGSPTAPQRMLTYFARKFIEAELILTGVAAGDARVAFEAALNASFSKVNDMASLASAPSVDGSAHIAAILAAYDATDANGKLEHIMTQKWIASFGFAIDAYTDYRRTGFPILHDGNTDNLDVTVRTRDYPNSFPWVNDNLSLNTNAPQQKIVTSNAAKPFWMQ